MEKLQAKPNLIPEGWTYSLAYIVLWSEKFSVFFPNHSISRTLDYRPFPLY